MVFTKRFYHEQLCVLLRCSREEGEYTADCGCFTGNADGYEGNCRTDSVRQLFLQDESYQELKRDYLALAVTVVDIAEEAAYLFDKESPAKRRNWKAELELEQYRHVLGLEEGEGNEIEKGQNS